MVTPQSARVELRPDSEQNFAFHYTATARVNQTTFSYNLSPVIPAKAGIHLIGG
jgi:hypothetical protein